MIAALLVEADRRLELRQDRHQHAGVAGQPERGCGAGAQQQLRQLPHAVSREAAADPLAGDEPDAARLLVHLSERLLVERETQLRHEPQAAHEAERILREASR